MGNLGPAWTGFIKSRRHAGQDRSHFEARCKTCVTVWVQELVDGSRDEWDVPSMSEAAALDYILNTSDDDRFPWHVGKKHKLYHHRSICPHATDSERRVAALEYSRCKLDEADSQKKRATKTFASNHPDAAHILAAQGSAAVPSSSSGVNTGLLALYQSDLPDFSAIAAPGGPPPAQRRHVGEEPAAYMYRTPNPQGRTHDEQRKFERDVLRLLVVLNIAFFAIEHPFLRYFFATYMDGFQVPGRKQLSGRILNEVSDEAASKIKESGRGRYASNQSDSWKNPTGTTVTGSVTNIDGTCHILNVKESTTEKKDGETFLKWMLEELQYCLVFLGLQVIAWCTDDGPDCAKARRLLRNLRPWLITTPCWAHQVNLIVGEYLKCMKQHRKTMEDALDVVKWFNHHGRALGLLRKEQMSTFGKILVLILPCLTRWTSHYLAVRRLLELRVAFSKLTCDPKILEILLVCAGKKQEQLAEAERIVGIICREGFWDELAEIRKVLEPLAGAANVTQADHADLGTVLLTLAYLYQVFDDPDHDPDLRLKIQSSIERRWKKVDREIFILALVFNPYIRTDAFAPDSTFRSVGTLWPIVVRAYKRLFQTTDEPDLAFRRDFGDYLRRSGVFAESSWDLGGPRAQAKAEGRPLSLVDLWRDHELLGPNPPMNGRHGLVHLAMRILSVVPNSAGVERLFSLFGIVHSKLRNRLSPQVVQKSTLVKADTERTSGKNDGTHLAKRKRHELEEDDAFVALLTSIRAASLRAPSAPSDAPESAGAASTISPSASGPSQSHTSPSSTETAPSGASPTAFADMADELEAAAAADDEDVDADDAAAFVTTGYSANDIRISALFLCAFYDTNCFVLTSPFSVWHTPEQVLQPELDLHEEYSATLSALLAELNVSSAA